MSGRRFENVLPNTTDPWEDVVKRTTMSDGAGERQGNSLQNVEDHRSTF